MRTCIGIRLYCAELLGVANTVCLLAYLLSQYAPQVIVSIMVENLFAFSGELGVPVDMGASIPRGKSLIRFRHVVPWFLPHFPSGPYSPKENAR